MEKESFEFRKSWFDAIREMPAQVRLEVYEAIIEYGISGRVPDLKAMARMAFGFVKGDMDREETMRAHRAALSETRRRAASARWGKEEDTADNAGNVLHMQNKDLHMQNNNLHMQNENLHNAKINEKNSTSLIIKNKEERELYKSKKKNKQEKEKLVKVSVAQKRDDVPNPTFDADNKGHDIETNVEAKTSEAPADTSPVLADVEARCSKFYDSLVPYMEKYGKKMIRRFYDYWTEPTRSGKKLRFELERTWSLQRRLATWYSREWPQHGKAVQASPSPSSGSSIGELIDECKKEQASEQERIALKRENERKAYEGMLELVRKNPRSHCACIVEAARKSGKLRELGLE